MQTKSLIAPAAMFALVVAHDIRTQIKARKDRQFAVEILETQELYAQELYEKYEAKLETAGRQIEYLVGMLNEHDIVPDEFDLIALNFHS